MARAYREGAHLAPRRAVGTITSEEFLRDQLAAGALPYADAFRALHPTRRPGQEFTSLQISLRPRAVVPVEAGHAGAPPSPDRQACGPRRVYRSLRRRRTSGRLATATGGHHGIPRLALLTGTCREAFTRYQEIFGGQLDLLPMSEIPAETAAAAPEGAIPADIGDLIMHAALKVGDGLLMASDDPTGDGGPKKGAAVSYSKGDASEAERIFGALAEEGTITMPMGETFWSPMFGMCADRFGVPWMVGVETPNT